MATPVELRHLCLLMAAGGLACGRRGGTLPSSVRCALYMLVAFALRRGNLGRELLRGTSSRSRGVTPNDHSQSPSTLLRRGMEQLGTRLNILKDKEGLPYLCCS